MTKSLKRLAKIGVAREPARQVSAGFHGGKLGDTNIYGRESNAPTRRLAVMNLALRGIEADFGPEHADTFRRDLHPDHRADTATRGSVNLQPRSHLAGLLRSERQLLANPPYNDTGWFRKDDDVRFFSLSASNGERAGVRCRKLGFPPKGNANFAWVQHFIHHLAPGGAGTAGGMAGFVLANGSMSSNQSGDCPAPSAMKRPKAKPQSLPRQRDIRRALIEADLVDCMVALPA